jgi:hypothetical protein
MDRYQVLKGSVLGTASLEVSRLVLVPMLGT